MSDANVPLYQKIYNHLMDGIRNGQFREGDKIPSEKELAEEFSVSRITTKKALEMMVENGCVTRIPGKGTYVTGGETLKTEQQEVQQEEERKRGEKLLGIILPDFSESYGVRLLAGIEHEASEQGCFVVVKRSRGRQDIEEKVLDELMSLGVDGIVIMPVHGEHYNPKILRLMLDGFPVVSVDRFLSGIPIPFVGTDNQEASRKATEYMFEMGHSHIALLSPPHKDTTAIEERIEGFMRSHGDRGLMADQSLWLTDLICTMPNSNFKENIPADIGKIRTLLRENPQITCLYALEYNIALLALAALRELNIQVPGDISVVCFDSPGIYVGEYFFTHVRQREHEMGEEAVRLVLGQMQGDDSMNRKIYLEADLVPGTSTRKIS